MPLRPVVGVRWSGGRIRPALGLYYTPNYRPRYRRQPYIAPNRRSLGEQLIRWALIIGLGAFLLHSGGHP